MKGCMWRNIIVLNLILFLMVYPASSNTGLRFRTLQTNSNNNTTSKSNEKEINNYIYSLKYNPDEVLAYKGASSWMVKAEGRLTTDKDYLVITRERKSIWNSKAEIGVISSNEQRTYPGSLLLANYRLMDNNPDIVAIDRAPIVYTVNLPGMGSNGSFTIDPTFANYEAAVNNVLNIWFKKYSDTHTVNTAFQSSSSFAYSKEQLRVKFGLEFQNSVVEVGTDFSAVAKQEKLIMIVRIQQVFYTVSVQSPNRPAMLFGNGVTREELAIKFNDENPPVLVDSVSYGRVIYLKVQTTSTDDESKSLLEAKLTNTHWGLEAGTDFGRQLENFEMHVYIMGGSPDHINLIKAKTLAAVNEIITKNGKFSSKNLGHPISYSTEFIKDNKRAVVKSTADYTESTSTIRRKGLIKIEHTGWYVAQFQVKWDKISYDRYGNKKVRRRGLSSNGDDKTAKYTDEFELDGNCENISFHAKECTGLFWEWWRTVIDRVGIPLIKERTFSIWGTTLSPHYSIVPGL